MRTRLAFVVAGVVVAGLLGVVAVSGVRLHQLTRPVPPQAVGDIDDLVARVEAQDTWRAAHRYAGIGLSVALPMTLVALGVVVMRADAVPAARPMGAVLVGSVLLVVTVYLGLAVPWDQAALWAVTVGEDLAEFTPVFGDDARVDLGFGEVSGRTLFRLGQVHKWVLSVPIVLSYAYLAGLAWRAGKDPLGRPDLG